MQTTDGLQHFWQIRGMRMTEQARLYGTVLYELKLPKDMLERCEAILKDSKELKEVLKSPVVRQEKKDNIIEKLFRDPEFSAIMRNFLKKTCKAGCIDQMEDIFFVSRQKAREAAGILSAKLSYVTEPDEKEIRAIRDFLCRTYGKQDVELSMQEEPELIGGFVLQTGNLEYDYSLRNQLRRMFGR